MDTQDVLIRVPVGLVPDGHTLEWRSAKKDEKYLGFHGGISLSSGEDKELRIVVVPTFDLVTWWPEWLKQADRVERDAGEWVAFEGKWTRIANLTRLGVDCSQLDGHTVYHNPNRKDDIHA